MARLRRARLLAEARKNGYDGLVATEPQTLFYMTGFWGEAIGLLDSGGASIIAPSLEAGRAKKDAPGCRIIPSERGSCMLPDLRAAMRAKRPCTDCPGHAMLSSLKKAVPKIRHDPAPFLRCRLVKDEPELRALRAGSRIISGMFELCSQIMRPGQKESELQSELMHYAMRRGMFDTGYASTLNPLIIAGGPNGALPHAQVTGRKLVRGDMVVVDLTLRYKGYVSDATRTFAVRRAPPKAKEVYDIVRQSQAAGLRAARPGASCSAVDAACRSIIKEAGYEKYFIHSTGHGVGLDVHEAPSVSAASKEKLASRMAVTIEPGIYLPGKLGVRIEDSVIIGPKLCNMHKFTKQLVEA